MSPYLLYFLNIFKLEICLLTYASPASLLLMSIPNFLSEKPNLFIFFLSSTLIYPMPYTCKKQLSRETPLPLEEIWLRTSKTSKKTSKTKKNNNNKQKLISLIQASPDSDKQPSFLFHLRKYTFTHSSFLCAC